MPIEHANGTVTTTADTVTWTNGVGAADRLHNLAMSIVNSGTTNNLLVSFDSGTTQFTLEPKRNLDIDGSVRNFQVKSNTSTTTYEALMYYDAWE